MLRSFEDLHWVDPTTLELIGAGARRHRRLQVMFLLTARPDFVPPWLGHPHVTPLTLNRLGREPTAAIIGQG